MLCWLVTRVEGGQGGPQGLNCRYRVMRFVWLTLCMQQFILLLRAVFSNINPSHPPCVHWECSGYFLIDRYTCIHSSFYYVGRNCCPCYPASARPACSPPPTADYSCLDAARYAPVNGAYTPNRVCTTSSMVHISLILRLHFLPR